MAVFVPTCAPSEESRIGFEQVLEAMTREVDPVAAEVADAIHAHLLDELVHDQYDGTLRSTCSNVQMVLTMLSEGVNPYRAVLLPDGLAYAKDFARRELSLELLLRVYRKGEAAFARIWLERLRATLPTPELLAQAFGFLNDWLFAWGERMETQLTQAYTAERDRWVRGTAAMRAAEVRSLLDDPHADPREASRHLNYELDREHLAYVIWPDHANPETDPTGAEHLPHGEMERLASEVADLMGAHALLTVPLGWHLACWAASWTSPDVDGLPARFSSAMECGLQVAVGNPARGLEGFRRSHQEALLSRNVARLARRSPGRCVRFSEVALDALLTHQIEEARQFVGCELGALVEDSDSARRLRATLTVFLEENGSFLHAGQRLGVHENTVSYRVRRAEELLGRRVGERQLELKVALRLARLTL